ncbi:MAG: response regulator, partial [Pseudomonadota bacterium]
LIVDDEPDVRRFLVAAITHLGYEVVEAGDGHEALAMLSSDAPKPDLVLLDTSMPAISGEQTLTLLHEQLPELPAVVMSGHDLPQVRERFKGQHVRQFLQKPFGIKQLRRCLAGIASTK